MNDSARPMTRGTKVVVALLVALIVGVISGFMYLVTTFLFHGWDRVTISRRPQLDEGG